MTTTTTSTSKSEETQVYRVFIRATPEAIWNAITNPEWNYKYGYGSRAESRGRSKHGTMGRRS